MKFRNLFEVKKLRSARSAYQFDMELGFWGVPGFNERVETGIGEKKINVSLNSDGDREKEITEIDYYLSFLIVFFDESFLSSHSNHFFIINLILTGRMAEWSNAAVLKTAEPETVPGGRIPLLPPFLVK